MRHENERQTPITVFMSFWPIRIKYWTQLGNKKLGYRWSCSTHTVRQLSILKHSIFTTLLLCSSCQLFKNDLRQEARQKTEAVQPKNMCEQYSVCLVCRSLDTDTLQLLVRAETSHVCVAAFLVPVPWAQVSGHGFSSWRKMKYTLTFSQREREKAGVVTRRSEEKRLFWSFVEVNQVERWSFFESFSVSFIAFHFKQTLQC